jgi:hypothetical protein
MFTSKQIIVSLVLFISAVAAIGQIDQNYWEKKRNAFVARTTAECQSSLKFCLEVLKVNPHHPVMNYLAARLYEQLGNSDVAFKHLKKAAQLGYTSKIRWLKMHPMNDPAFSSLRKKEKFEEIVRIMNVSDKPIHKSQVAFTVNKKHLGKSGGYEGITYDPVEKMFYLGSDYKIVRTDHSGNCINFTKDARKDGLGRINGVRVDPVRRTLLACSNDKNYANGEIFKYDLLSGKLIKKYAAPSDGERHFFNDLVIHPNGDVYITDTGEIFKIPHDSDKLELFFKNRSFCGSNGITLSDDGKVIYATEDINGICKIDIKTKSFRLLTHQKNFYSYGIDGLYFADNYLYAVQAELLTQVCRFSLNEDATHLESCEFFERNTPDLNGPSTGVLVDDYFYFLAGENQKEVVVMKTSIK